MSHCAKKQVGVLPAVETRWVVIWEGMKLLEEHWDEVNWLFTDCILPANIVSLSKCNLPKLAWLAAAR